MNLNPVIWGIPHLVKRPTTQDIGISRKDNRWFRCIYKDKDAWTNTHIADTRQPQYNDFLLMPPRRASLSPPDLEKVIPLEICEKPLTILITTTRYAQGKPINENLFLSDGENTVQVNPAYYDYFAYFYPDATMHFTGPISPVIVKHKDIPEDGIAGLLLPVRGEDNAIEVALRMAKKES